VFPAAGQRGAPSTYHRGAVASRARTPAVVWRSDFGLSHITPSAQPEDRTPVRYIIRIAARVATGLLWPSPPHIRSGVRPTLRQTLWRALRALRRLPPPTHGARCFLPASHGMPVFPRAPPSAPGGGSRISPRDDRAAITPPRQRLLNEAVRLLLLYRPLRAIRATTCALARRRRNPLSFFYIRCSFPLISAHFRSFPLVSARFRSFLLVSARFRSFPLVSAHFMHFARFFATFWGVLDKQVLFQSSKHGLKRRISTTCGFCSLTDARKSSICPKKSS